MKKTIIGIISVILLASFEIGCKNHNEVSTKDVSIEKQSEASSNEDNEKGNKLQNVQLVSNIQKPELIGNVQKIKKTLVYEKDMTGYNSISLPFVVGDINVSFTDTQNLKVNVDVISDGNDESYQKSMLDELVLKAKEEAGEVELAPYRGDNMLYDTAADYNRNKCLIKMNYSIQIPKSVRNINLSSTDGTINSDSIECNKLNIKSINGKFISKGISAKEILLNATSSDVKINEEAVCDNMNMKVINGKLEMNKFEGMINGEATSSTFTISNASLKNQSNIKNVGKGNATLGIDSMEQGSNLSIKSYTGDVNLKINENAKCTLNCKQVGKNDKETKTFNGGGSDINVELIGGKLVI